MSALALSFLFWWIALFSTEASQRAVAQKAAPPPRAEAVFYAVGERPTIFAAPDSTRPYLELDFREPVFSTGTLGGWRRVRTSDGAMGYVRAEAVSNVWLRVSKRRQAVYLYRGSELVGKLPADFGYNIFADKEQRGGERKRDHWRTPEGTFYVVRKNPRSQFHKALVINYPTVEDAQRGFQRGLISKRERDAIVQAQEAFQMPPMGTALGGMIEIHGDGTGAQTNWTHGCVAVPNVHMNLLYRTAQVGTPVLIE